MKFWPRVGAASYTRASGHVSEVASRTVARFGRPEGFSGSGSRYYGNVIGSTSRTSFTLAYGASMGGPLRYLMREGM